MIIKNLIKNLSSNDWERALNASDELVKINSKDIVPQLILVLNMAETTDTVNATALALREIGGKESVPFLIQALNNPLNKNNKSTIVYALENLDCSKYFLTIFDLFVFSKKDDVRLSAYSILKEQKFTLTDSELKKANEMLSSSEISSDDKEISEKFISQVKRDK